MANPFEVDRFEIIKTGHGYAGTTSIARIKYDPFSLFDVATGGILRHGGMLHWMLDFVGESGAIRVLRSLCEVYPQSAFHSLPFHDLEELPGLALKGQVVGFDGTKFYLYAHDDGLVYLMATYKLLYSKDHGVSTLLRITPSGLELCGHVSKEAGVALDESCRPIVWRVQ